MGMAVRFTTSKGNAISRQKIQQDKTFSKEGSSAGFPLRLRLRSAIADKRTYK